MLGYEFVLALKGQLVRNLSESRKRGAASALQQEEVRRA
jgi:hypothetical protein